MRDLEPRKGPPYATEDGSVPQDARRRQGRATGTTESSPLTVAQMNVEGISRKKLELPKKISLYTQHRCSLHSRNSSKPRKQILHWKI